MQIAKITRPVLRGIVQRKRLFQQLEHSRERPVIWVTGPPGCGKTTLIASYLDSYKMPFLWYKVDEGDADIATFFYYMGLAAKKAAPHKRKHLPLLTPEYLLGIPTFTLRFFEELYSRLKTPFAVVLDNYQQAPSESKFHDVIKDGLSVIPEKINVILISRGSLPRQLVRLQANNKMTLLGWNEIRFTLNETREVVQMRRRKDLTDKMLLQLHKKTDGWAAGLVLMLEMAKIKGIDYQFTDKLIPEEIFDYFASEIFDKTDRETQDFLLKTAFLPQINPQTAKELTDNSQANRILFDLNQKNYFTQKYVLQTESYQYHPLFREFLLTRARNSFEPSILAEIKKKAAALLEADGQIEDAVALLHETGEWQGMIRLILQQAPLMIVQGRNMTILQWLQGIPEDLVEKNPRLLYWMGVCLIPLSPGECGRYFDKALGLFQAGKDAAGVFLSLVGMFEAVVFRLDTFEELDRLIATLYGALDEFREFPSEQIEASVVKAFLLAMVMRKPQLPDAEQWISRGLALSKKLSDSNVAIILCAITFYYIFTGKLERAAQILDLSRGVTKAGSAAPLSNIILKNAEAFYYWTAGEFEKNREAADEGLALADASGVHAVDNFLFGHGAAGALCAGDIKRAEHLLRGMSSSLDRLPSAYGSSYYHELSSWTALLKKDLIHANFHAGLALKFAVEAGSPFTTALEYLINAIVMHEQQREEDALQHISLVRDIFSTLNVYQVEFRYLLAEAEFAFDREDEEAGTEALRKAMKLGKDYGYTNTYFWLPSVMVRLCRKALDAGIEVEYVQNLIHKRNLIPDFPPYECENWPWPIKIFTFGRFGLIKEGSPAESSKKIQHKPLSLLKALVALGGREVDEARLADILWPETEGDSAFSAFTTTLSRLRQLLGIENAIKVKKGKITLDSRYCYVDSWVFERLAAKVEELWGQSQTRSSIEEVIRLTEKAIAMYRGSFLSADDEHWAISYRERLRSKFLRLVFRLGNHLENSNQCEKAVYYYKKTLEVDNLAEEFYQRLMVCYQHLGQQAEAMRVYKRCHNVLSAALGIEPSSKTEAIYKKITANVRAQSSNDK